MKQHIQTNTLRLFCLLITLNVTGCLVFTSITSGVEFNHYKVEKHKVALAVPTKWEVAQNDFYQLQATGSIKGIHNISIHYKGIKKSILGYSEKKEYTKGWYDAFILSYKNYEGKIISKSNYKSPSGLHIFQFIAKYKDPKSKTLMQKVGRLHFQSQYIHALYYTVPQDDFNDTYPLFQLMEQKHKFTSLSQ